MFQKVRIRLTLLCAGITIFILLIMSCGWLYVSEKSLRDNSFISFQNDMNTLVGNLEQQPVISGGWLKNMEDNGKYLIWLLDNGVPFLHNRQNQSAQDNGDQHRDRHIKGALPLTVCQRLLRAACQLTGLLPGRPDGSHSLDLSVADEVSHNCFLLLINWFI